MEIVDNDPDHRSNDPAACPPRPPGSHSSTRGVEAIWIQLWCLRRPLWRGASRPREKRLVKPPQTSPAALAMAEPQL